MSSDRSRRTDRVRHGYTGIAAQQGRVILDRDMNALQGLIADRREAQSIDVIGPCGTPDNGFAISLPDANPSPPQFYSPPAGSPPAAVGGVGDLIIAPGTMYLGGQRVMFPAMQNGVPVQYSYFDQPDWPSPDVPAGGSDQELVYLDVTEQEVSAAEDPDLLDVALGGPDTTQRIKLLRRVRRMPVAAGDCMTAWQQAVAQFAAAGLAFDPATMRLAPQASLQIGFTQGASSSDPCDPVATGGYLGGDNQLIRIRTVNAGGTNAGNTTALIWGYDNASFLYRVTRVSTDGTLLTLASDPPDGFHVPQAGQLVEILATAAVLGQEPDETDPTGVSTILRVCAEAQGFLATLAQAYGPVTPGDPTQYIVLPDPGLPFDLANSPLPLFLRVWQAQLSLPPGGGLVELADPTTNISTGLTATITLPPSSSPPSSIPGSSSLPDGAFWQVAVRPATPQGVYPEELLTSPQPPDGPRRWVCPLAVVAYRDQEGDAMQARYAVLSDCRNSFADLVALTARRPGCCTVGISPSDVTAATPLQALIDQAASMGLYVTVCLEPGEYTLPQSLQLSYLHDYMTIECGNGDAFFFPDSAADPAQFVDGLIVVQGFEITLRGLTLYAPVAPLPAAMVSQLQTLAGNLGFSNAAALIGQSYAGFGVRGFNAYGLSVAQCTIWLEDFTGASSGGDVFAAAIYLQGDCFGFSLQDCEMETAFPTTFTPLTIEADVVSPNAARTFQNAMERLRLPPAEAAVASPPPAPARIAERSSAALGAVLAQRAALPLDATVPPVIMTFGVLASEFNDTSNGDSFLYDCYLGDALLQGNAMQSLSVGAWISAVASTIRVQDNVITGGIAGIWQQFPGGGQPQETVPPSYYYQSTPSFAEFQLGAYVFAANFPQPGALATASVASAARAARAARFTPVRTKQQAARAARAPKAAVAAPAQATQARAGAAPADVVFESSSDFTLFLTGNKVETRAPYTIAAGAWGCAAALFLNLEGQNAPSGGSAIIVSANHLVSAAGYYGPTGLVVLPNAMPCSITGNIVLNTGPADPVAVNYAVVPSLWLTVDGAANGTQLIAVTGNVFSGRSDMDELERPGVSVSGGWTTFNADPS